MSILHDVTCTFRINVLNFVTCLHNISMYGDLLQLTVENIPDYVANLGCHNKKLGISQRRVGLPYNFVCLGELARVNMDRVPPKIGTKSITFIHIKP
jgi:hypothetical protein